MNTLIHHSSFLSKSVVIALDAMGGDHGPDVVIPGAALALKTDPDIQFLFFGDEQKVQGAMARFHFPADKANIIHAERSIGGHEKPSSALRASKGTSMRAAIEAVEQGQAEAVVSAGNTGALMALAMSVLKTLPGIHRPALAGVFPGTRTDTVMLDLGANVLVDSENLVEFAVLGAVFARILKDIARPRVGLLNVGTEEGKGPDHVRAAAASLSQISFPGTYAGFVEGTDLLRSAVDVVVCDGYAGNIALKTAEGVSKFTIDGIKAAIKSDLLAMVGGALASFALKRFKKRVDPRLYNGAVFLGLNGLCIKSHGGADALAFANAIQVAAKLARAGYIQGVAKEITALQEQGVVL